MLLRLSPLRLATAGLAVLVAAFLVLWLVPSGSYLFLPDPARPVAPLVSVPHPRDDRDGGGVYFVDVVVRKATLLERLFPGIREGATLVPSSELNPPGVGEAARQQEDLRAMARSQSIAAAVALRALGYHVVARPTGVLIDAVAPDGPAAGKLAPTDVVVSLDGSPVRTPADLRRLMRARRPGEVVRLGVRRGTRTLELRLRTVHDPHDRARALIGVLIEQSATIRLPVNVRIDAGQIGGPSAGLAFALDVVEEVGHDVDRGYRIAATGEIALDGSVTPIGGVEQKTIGARLAHADYFLVPAGDNAREARRYAKGLRVVPVESFRQALQFLATLPRKH